MAKIRKSSKSDQKVSKMSIFLCLSDWELKCFWLGRFCDHKIDFRRISKFWPKKNLKSVYSTVKVKNGQKWPKYVKVRKVTKKYLKCQFFYVLAIGNSNAFGQEGFATIKSISDGFRNFGQKKISNQSTLQSKSKIAKNSQNT